MSLDRAESLHDLHMLARERLATKVVHKWNTEDVVLWIKTIQNGRFGMYDDNFRAQHIDGAALMNCTDSDLRDRVGIAQKLHRTTLLAHVKRLKVTKFYSNTFTMDGYDVSAETQQPNATTPSRERGDSIEESMMSRSSVASVASRRLSRKRSSLASLGRDRELSTPTNHQRTSSLTDFLGNIRKSLEKSGSTRSFVMSMWQSNESDIVLADWLYKKGEVVTSFKQRWCVLCEDGNLFYFDTRFPSKDVAPKGYLSLHDVKSISVVEHDDGTYSNGLILQTGTRDWSFAALDSLKLVEWKQALDRMKRRLRREKRLARRKRRRGGDDSDGSHASDYDSMGTNASLLSSPINSLPLDSSGVSSADESHEEKMNYHSRPFGSSQNKRDSDFEPSEIPVFHPVRKRRSDHAVRIYDESLFISDAQLDEILSPGKGGIEESVEESIEVLERIPSTREYE